MTVLYLSCYIELICFFHVLDEMRYNIFTKYNNHNDMMHLFSPSPPKHKVAAALNALCCEFLGYMKIGRSTFFST